MGDGSAPGSGCGFSLVVYQNQLTLPDLALALVLCVNSLLLLLQIIVLFFICLQILHLDSLWGGNRSRRQPKCVNAAYVIRYVIFRNFLPNVSTTDMYLSITRTASSAYQAQVTGNLLNGKLEAKCLRMCIHTRARGNKQRKMHRTWAIEPTMLHESTI